jgi:hypothetical protein
MDLLIHLNRQLDKMKIRKKSAMIQVSTYSKRGSGSSGRSNKGKKGKRKLHDYGEQ